MLDRLKEVEKAMHSLKTKLLIIDCVTTLFLKVAAIAVLWILLPSNQRLYSHEMLALSG